MKRLCYLTLSLLIGVVAACQRGSKITQSPADAKAKETHASHSSRQEPMPGMQMANITLNASQEQFMGIQTQPARSGELSKAWWLTGTTVFDPAGVKTWSAWFSGWITHLYVRNPGEYVQQGQPLYEMYSPELLADEKAYIAAWQHAQHSSSSDNSNILFSLKQRLLRWGLDPSHIQALPFSAPTGAVTVYSQAKGYITKRYKQEGDHVETGEPVLQLTQISTIWVEVQLDPTLLPSLVENTARIAVQLPAHPGRIFTGRLVFPSPIYQPGSLVNLAQIQITSPGIPIQDGEMAYVKWEMKTQTSHDVRIPASSILYQTGEPVVWIQQHPHVYERRSVHIAAIQAQEALVSGIKPGERVVVQGNYLLNSQYILEMENSMNMSGMQM
ncbi:MAG: efflux RND transporter periplasmic adaptor subunit [Thermoflavifilum sp.]|nr:efflux RND transporter periplasmic adaptor subunit [Thermoflavifilum sp.]